MRPTMLLDSPVGLGLSRPVDLDLDVLPCRIHDPELWFAERTADVEQAKALCRACPIIDSCLAGACDRGEPWGVWGGEVFIGGVVVATKRGRGRPPRHSTAA